MEIICISDTHSNHDKLMVPNGDVLIHAGDITEAGTKREVLSFLRWFSNQPHPYKIFIAGNHDFYLENLSFEKLGEILPKNVSYLKDSGVEINGISFWGSPMVPGNGHWAFTEPSTRKIGEHWKKIPEDVDVLITHSPPYGILDQSGNKLLLGCKPLRKKVAEIKPKYHLFGHLHDNHGTVRIGGTTYVNSTTFTSDHKLINPPIKVVIR